jgi:type I restriction enzyme M protein
LLPDNCLFEDKAGEVFEILTQDCSLHTILRLPRGTFTPYSQGVKANVIFFQKGVPTEHVWIFDARSNVPGITKKDRPLSPEHFTEFEQCYGHDPNGQSKRTENVATPDTSPKRERGTESREPSLARRARVNSDRELSGETGRFRCFAAKEIAERSYKLDITWLKDDSLESSDELPDPQDLATEAITELEAVVDDLKEIVALVEKEEGVEA